VKPGHALRALYYTGESEIPALKFVDHGGLGSGLATFLWVLKATAR
jgi:hypothetical protein